MIVDFSARRGVDPDLWFSLPLLKQRNLTKIGDRVGKATAIDSYTLEFTKLDTTRIKIETNQPLSINPLTVSDGIEQ